MGKMKQTAKAPKDRYLISLHGGGDAQYYICGQATWDFIHSKRPTFAHFSAVEQAPQAVIDEMSNPQEFDVMTEGGKINVSTGSCENDRALVLAYGFDYQDRPPKGSGDVTDVYEGCIY